jgi:hypothetical protein
MNKALYENPRLQRIQKVGRFFRWLCLLSMIGGTLIAITLWFLPIVGDEVKGESKYQWKRTQEGSGDVDSEETKIASTAGSITAHALEEEPRKEAVLVEAPAAAQMQSEFEEHSDKPDHGDNERWAVGWRIGFGPQGPPGEEKLRPEFSWIVRPLGFLAVLFHLLGLWIIYRLFRFYESGLIFAPQPVRCIFWIGVWLLAKWTLTNLEEASQFFTHNPSFIDLRINGYLLGGLLVLLVSWIMEEGSKLQEEQDLTI